jgi:histidine triad (HIT) family protein
MQNTIFTKIINGEIPCHKIYEDDLTFAFLDIHPVQPGHVLVVPKMPIEYAWDLPNDVYQALMATCKIIAVRMRSVLDVPRVGMQIEGLDVPHVHVKLIPFTTHEEFFHHPNMAADPDHPALAAMAQRLAFDTVKTDNGVSNV